MSLSSLTPRVALAGCTGLLLLGGIVGAVTVDASPNRSQPTSARVPDDQILPVPTTTSTEPAGAGGEPSTVPTTAPGLGTAPTRSVPAPTAPVGATTTPAGRPGPPTTPGPLMAPKVGTYTYDTTSTSARGTRTAPTTTKVEAAGTEGATTIQAVTVALDLGGQQAMARNTVAWGTAGAVVRRSVITFSAGGSQQIDCVWQPAFAQYAGALAVGRTWSFDTRCAAQIQGFDVTVQQRATRRVTAAAQVAGPSGAVATWTIADDTTLTVTTPIGVATVHTVGTQSLAPSLGLPVRTEARVDSSAPGSAPEQSTLSTKLVAGP